MDKKSDLELNIACAMWLKFQKVEKVKEGIFVSHSWEQDGCEYGARIKFEPLTNWQQFMEMVLPKFLNNYFIVLAPNIFNSVIFKINSIDELLRMGSFPSDLRRSVLKMISEMEEGK